MSHSSFDIIIVGGGIIGSFTAYHLVKADQGLKVLVVEKDPTYERASTTLSMANARIQFCLKENVQMSQYALDVLEHFEDDMAVDDDPPNILYRQEGNLILVNQDTLVDAQKAFAMQKALGCDIEWWTPEEIKALCPLYQTDGFLAGTFGPKDGHFDAYGLLMGTKAKARSLGAVYLQGEVVAVLSAGRMVMGVRLANNEKIQAPVVINCAGAWCTQVAETAGVSLPIIPVGRQVFAVDSAIRPEGPLPLTLLPSGLYFRTETGGLILIGKSMDEDNVGFNFDWDPKRFTEILWPEIYEFVPAFDRLKLVRGWAGLYAVNTLDHNAILGEWPELKGFYLANGFSGHGVQQGPAVGPIPDRTYSRASHYPRPFDFFTPKDTGRQTCLRGRHLLISL
jgi:FAD-dependent oxidoreductase domain-containing protein 1